MEQDHQGGAVGFGLSKNVKEGYGTWSIAFDPGDEIFLFGFSRGAYTARTSPGSSADCGILERKTEIGSTKRSRALSWRGEARANQEAVTFAKGIRTESRDPVHRSVGHRRLARNAGPRRMKTCQQDQRALGIPGHQAAERLCDSAYQALAIDEKRKPFEPTLWVAKPDPAGRSGTRAGVVLRRAGACNVGGGYASSELSNIPLVWMLKRAKEHDLELNQEIGDAEHVGG